MLHLSEGVDDDSRRVFHNLQRKDGSWLLSPNLLGIHATGLASADLSVMSGSGGIVWSPLSNFLLYGTTTDIRSAMKAGVPIALGADWAPSGSKNLLGEMKIARLVSKHENGLLSDRAIVEMVTCIPAKMIGWESWLGSIEAGHNADLVVIAGKSKPPYSDLIDATEADLIAVLIDGRPRLGRADMLDPGDPKTELVRVASTDFLIDLTEPTNDPLAGLRLDTAIAKLTYGLKHLPDLAAKFGVHLQYLGPSATRYMLVLDMDEANGSAKQAFAPTAIGPGDVDPMELEPLTAADDSSFIPRLKASRNIPAWLKQLL
jgi:hypothetical protein